MATIKSEWAEFRAFAVSDGLEESQVMLVRNVFMSGVAAALTVAHEHGLPAAILELVQYSIVQDQELSESPGTGSQTQGLAP